MYVSNLFIPHMLSEAKLMQCNVEKCYSPNDFSDVIQAEVLNSFFASVIIIGNYSQGNWSPGLVNKVKESPEILEEVGIGRTI